MCKPNSAIVRRSDIIKVVRLHEFFELDVKPLAGDYFLVTIGEKR